MDLKQIAKDTAKTVTSYLTYQALRTVILQLSETDPPQAMWLQRFSAQEKLQDGEAYLRGLFQERPDLGFRLLTVREHLAQEISDFLPELVKTGIQQSNMQLRCEQLERMTQVAATAGIAESEPNSEDETEGS
ncbi:MAG TPA: chaperonin family protein RbcX [Synechococcales cyanobacterium M55_K2018_004]|nr:chaperonin family protein RbcX [Synechococcales cyanobacterium M55_K2018_004]